MNTTSTLATRWLLWVSLALAAGCPGPEVDTDAGGDTDTLDCDAAPDRETFIAEEIPSICDWELRCPDQNYDSREQCLEGFERQARRGECWNDCAVAECLAFFDQNPNCESSADIPLLCIRVASCEL